MANPRSLRRPPAGERYDPTAIDATGTTLGYVLAAVSDGTGGQRAGYVPTVSGLPPLPSDAATVDYALGIVGGAYAWRAVASTTFATGFGNNFGNDFGGP